MDILERIGIIQQESTDSMRSFELSIGKTSGYIGMMKRRQSVPGADVLSTILSVYPNYYADWLLMGIEPKLKKQNIMLNELDTGHNRHVIKEPDPAYSSKGQELIKHLEDWIVEIIKRETGSKK